MHLVPAYVFAKQNNSCNVRIHISDKSDLFNHGDP